MLISIAFMLMLECFWDGYAGSCVCPALWG